MEQWVRSELESTDLRESFNILGKTTKKEDKEEPRKQGLKLNVISGRTFGMTKQGTKIMSIISVAGHQVVKDLSEPSEITLVHLDIYADYLKEKDPKLDSRAVRALLTTGGPRLMKVNGPYIDVHGPYPILMNVDGINIYTKAHITDANDQIGRIYIGQEELKVRRIGHNAMLEQDAVHIGCEADLAAHVLDVQGRQLSVKGLLDTGAVVSFMPVKTWTDIGFERSDLIPTNIRLAAANQGAIYVTERTPIISLQLGGRHLWMSFLVVENLDESDQFILGRDFVRNFDVTIDLKDGLVRIKDPERKYEKKPLNKILINQAKVPIFLDRKVRLKPNRAVVATFRMRNLNELSNDRQVCLVPNPNSKSSAILGRSFSLTQSGLCLSVLPTVPQVSSVPDLTTVSQDTTMYASMFEPLNRSLETFITKLSKSTERGERSRRTLKKPKSYKDESDGCIDTWIEVMKLHFEEENLSKKQECSALTSNLEGTALSCVMAKRANERDSARKIFDILLNRFGSGVQGHQAMVKFEKRRQRDDEPIDKFLDDLELLRSRSNPDERISERNLAIASKFMDGVKSEELKTMLATHFTLSLDQVPTPDDMRMKSREYLLIKPRAQNRYSNFGNYSGTNTGANSSWYKPRDDMDKRRSCANLDSTDHHVSACSAYKQNMKAIGYFLDDVDATDEDHKEYVRGLIMKYGPRCFFCNLEGHFKSDCTQFRDAVADAKHPRHEEALSGVKASRARLMNEAESRRTETTPSTFTTKKVKTLPDEVVASNLEAESASPLKVDYGLAARTAL